MPSNFAYVRVTAIDDAVVRLSTPGARPCAGGTDLLGCLRDDVFQASTLVSLRGIDRLRGIEGGAGRLRLGALATIAEIARDARVREHYRALSEAAGVVGSPQLRNQGTLGGNLCQRPRCWFFRGGYPCARKGGDTCFAMQGDNRFHAILGGSTCFIVHPSDLAPALVALGADIQIAGAGGTRRLPIEQFFVLPDQDTTRETALGPGELLVDVTLPAPPSLSTYHKVRARGSWDFALAGAAVAITLRSGRIERARVVLSGAAPIPWRARAAEAALTGATLDAAVIRRAADAAVEGAQPLEHNAYKVALVRGVVEEALSDIGRTPDPGTRSARAGGEPQP